MFENLMHSEYLQNNTRVKVIFPNYGIVYGTIVGLIPGDHYFPGPLFYLVNLDFKPSSVIYPYPVIAVSPACVALA